MWAMQRSLGAGDRHKPVFHSVSRHAPDDSVTWKTWVDLVPLPVHPDRERRFYGRRSERWDSIQDAARDAVLHLRRYYDPEFDETVYDLIPQRVPRDGTYLTPDPREMDDPRLHVAARYIVHQETMYSRAIQESFTLRRQLRHVQRELYEIQQELYRRNLVEEGELSACDESPDVPAAPVPVQPLVAPVVPVYPVIPVGMDVPGPFRPRGDPDAPGPSQPRRRMTAPEYRSLFQPARATAPPAGDEEDPEEVVRYTDSRPPTEGW